MQVWVYHAETRLKSDLSLPDDGYEHNGPPPKSQQVDPCTAFVKSGPQTPVPDNYQRHLRPSGWASLAHDFDNDGCATHKLRPANTAHNWLARPALRSPQRACRHKWLCATYIVDRCIRPHGCGACASSAGSTTRPQTRGASCLMLCGGPPCRSSSASGPAVVWHAWRANLRDAPGRMIESVPHRCGKGYILTHITRIPGLWWECCDGDTPLILG